MVPKVMASPIAASSSTEPSEMPYQTFCAACPGGERLAHRIGGGGRGGLDLAVRRCRGRPAARPAHRGRRARARGRSPRSSVPPAHREASTLAARASLIARLMPRPSRRPAPCRGRPARTASRRLNRASAAPRRTLGSGFIRVSEPDGRLDGAAQAVVDPDAVEVVFGRAAGRLAGDGLGQRELVAVGPADDHELVGRCGHRAGRRPAPRRIGAARASPEAASARDRRLAIAEAAGGQVATTSAARSAAAGRAGDQRRGQRRQQHREQTQ